MSSTASPPAVVILQARTASQRLPGKALSMLAGRPLVVHCMERLLAARVGPVVLATTTAQADDGLARLADEMGVAVVRGSESDVLSRFSSVLAQFPARAIVRATADNPAVDIASPARVLRALESSCSDYVAEDDLPYGAGVEAVRSDVLMQAHQVARMPAEREHVTTWVKQHSDRFRVQMASAPRSLRRPDLRFTVDTPTELAYMRQVMDSAGCRRDLVPLNVIIHAADQLAAERAEVA